MGIYLSNMEMPKEGYVDVRIKCNGTASFAIADNPYFKAVEAVPVPPHGRLIDESAIDLSKYEKAAHDALHNGKGSILYDSGVLAGARAITRLVRNAPTVIEAEEGE